VRKGSSLGAKLDQIRVTRSVLRSRGPTKPRLIMRLATADRKAPIEGLKDVDRQAVAAVLL